MNTNEINISYYFVPNTDNFDGFEKWLLNIVPKIDGQPILGPYQKEKILEFINSDKINNQSYIRKIWTDTKISRYKSQSKWAFPKDFSEFKSVISNSELDSPNEEMGNKDVELDNFVNKFKDYIKNRKKRTNKLNVNKSYNDNSSFINSAMIAAATDSTMLGGLLGGNWVGAVVGDALDGNLQD